MQLTGRKSTAVVLTTAAALALCGGLCPASGAALGEIDVTQAPYSAGTSGTVDDTAAFQKALDAAGRTGAIVRVPAGQYLFRGRLTVPAQVVIEGINKGERSYGGYTDIGNNGGVDSRSVSADAGTVFLVTADAGSAGSPGTRSDTPFLTLNANSAIRNVSFFYPNQADPTGAVGQPNPAHWVPTPYPFTISMAGPSGSVENVTGVNPYQFIEAASPGGRSRRESIRRINGTPLMTGVFVDNDGDGMGGSTDCLEDIHFIPGWGNGTGLNWVYTHATAFQINRADGIILRSCFCFFYWYGYHFGSSGAGSASGTIINCGSDTSHIGVAVDSVDPAEGGLVFEGGAYSANATAVALAGSNTGDVTFNGSRFWGTVGGLVTNASARGSVVTFYACNFLDWAWGTSALDPKMVCIVCGDADRRDAPCGKTRIIYSHFKRDQYQYTCTQGEAGVLFKGNSVVNGVRALIDVSARPGSPGSNSVQTDNF